MSKTYKAKRHRYDDWDENQDNRRNKFEERRGKKLRKIVSREENLTLKEEDNNA